VRCRADLLLRVAPLRLPDRPWRLAVRDGDASVQGPLEKTEDRAHYDAARAAARAAGAHDALLLGPDGRVRETTVANVFFVLRDGALVTPPAADGLLPGIARGWLLERLGAEERTLRLDDVAGARECFVTNALMLAWPVAAVSGVAEYAPGPTAERAAAACRPRCG